MNELNVSKVLVFIAKEKRGDPGKQISPKDIQDVTGFETLKINQIMKYLREKGFVKYVEGVGWFDDVDLTAEGWDYIWGKEDTIKRLVKGTKFEKLAEIIYIAKEKLRE